MNTTLETPSSTVSLQAEVNQAIQRIAPLWPLTHFVAVNPYLGLTSQRFEQACGVLGKAAGVLPFQKPAEYLAALRQGRVEVADLEAVARPGWNAASLIRAMEHATGTAVGATMTFADFLDSQRPHAHWEVLVEDEVSKWCAVAYDENQTIWSSPWKSLGLFAGWRQAAPHDCNPEAYGLHGAREFFAALPHTADEVIEYCLSLLAQPRVTTVDFVHRQLMSISGWAGYLQYRVREASMRGASSREVHELLAIRLAYDAALFNAFARNGSQRSAWRRISSPEAAPEWIEVLVQWQQAYELHYQKQLAGQLTAAVCPVTPARPEVQAVFCIDVRSERIRRHLEAAMPGVQTIGFAGFFGFPIAHKPLGQDKLQSRAPVLLVPPLECPDHAACSHAHHFQQKWSSKRSWKAFQNSAASCFTFVETIGLSFAAKLLGSGDHATGSTSRVLPDLAAMPTAQLAAMAEGALRNMSLTAGFAKLVLICGHGSHSSNNPHASSLDCGACGGHAGDLNARLAAMTLNLPAVRQHLAQAGIAIPEDTVFVAGLHDTLEDTVEWMDGEQVPATHQPLLKQLQQALRTAGQATREERAPMLGLADLKGDALTAAIRKRGADISQVRPEWGLANNAALVVGPRHLTQGNQLDGRVFLHDYDEAADHEDKVLGLILSAPVVVASWINLQYYASRVNPEKFGSGDKVLHNVTGGIGVMEGNGGDLRTGLPMQSIHDGTDFVHEPQRLTVFIHASRAKIARVLGGLAGVRQLFDHQWIHLVAIEDGKAHLYQDGQWQTLPTP